MSEKLILVKTPVTSNGRDLYLGPDDKIVYKETILAASARPIIEKQNEKRTTALKHKISDYTPDPVKETPAGKYDALTKVQLGEELDKRGLSHSATMNKADLIEILEANDKLS